MSRRFQFSVLGVFAATLLIAFACGICQWFGLEVPEAVATVCIIGVLFGPIYLRA